MRPAACRAIALSTFDLRVRSNCQSTGNLFEPNPLRVRRGFPSTLMNRVDAPLVTPIRLRRWSWRRSDFAVSWLERPEPSGHLVRILARGRYARHRLPILRSDIQAMKIILASPRGFCAGVNMAIESLELAIKLYGTPIYVYHEIVHNKYVVDRFRRQGVVFVDGLDEVPPEAHLLYSAHGVSPEIRRISQERRLRTIDATCPLVTKVHLEAVRYAQSGHTIILIGHEGHDEVIGTMGEAPESMVLVQSPEDVDRLEFPPGTKLAYLTQTTLSVDDANRIIDRLRERFPQIANPPKEDICYATQNRQEAVKSLSNECHLVLVLGSQNSSNSQRLAELSRENGVPAYLVDGAEDIDPSWFQPDDTVLVTAGASAPERVVEECVDFLRQQFSATVESRSIREEEVYFPLPRELRSISRPVATKA